jgi:hypothetical protein
MPLIYLLFKFGKTDETEERYERKIGSGDKRQSLPQRQRVSPNGLC